MVAAATFAGLLRDRSSAANADNGHGDLLRASMDTEPSPAVNMIPEPANNI